LKVGGVKICITAPSKKTKGYGKYHGKCPVLACPALKDCGPL